MPGLEQLWIGLAEVIPRTGTQARAGMTGAYVQVAACAMSVDSYVAKAEAALIEEGFEVVEWDDVLPVGPGWPPSDADPSLVEAGRWAIEHDDVGLADLHWFPEQGDNLQGE